MDSHEPTLKSFFKDGKHAKEIAKKISKNPKFLELKRNAKKKLKGMKVPGYFYNDLPQKIIEKIDDLIDIKILDILIKAWIKCGEILKYRDTKKYPSNEVFQVHLFDHEIISEHYPYLEVTLNRGVALSKIEFKLFLTFLLKGIILEIQNAKVVKIHVGSCTGQGTLEYAGIRLLRKTSEPVKFPGLIDLGEGIPI